jgi:hypothetical protein
MANFAVEKKPIGGMDTDTNLQDVAPLDYIDAKNCQNIDKYERNNNLEIFPLGGNEYKFFLPDVLQQRKRIRIFIEKGQDPASLPSGAICDIDIYTQNGVLIGTININTTNSPNITSFAGQIQSQAAAFTPTFDVSSVAVNVNLISDIYFGYIDIVFNQYFSLGLPEDYSISISGNVVYGFQTEEESLSRDVTGKQKIIGRFNIEDDLFLWATTVRKTDFSPIEIASISNITVTAENSNAEIITVTPHGLFTGQQVILKDTGSLSGIWLVVVVDDFTIQLVNSAYQAYSVPSFNLLRKYVSGYGSIFYANRDSKGNWIGVNTNQSVATKLIGSKRLNFSTLNGVDATVKKNNFQTKFKFTDYRNPYRLLVYKGEYKTDGFMLNPITGEGQYTYDNLDESTRLIIGDVGIKVESVEEVVGSGQLTTKNYVFYARLVNNDFTKTPFSYPSSPYSLIKQDTTNNASSNIIAFNGDVSAEPTNKALKVKITNIPKGVYPFLEVAVIIYRLGTFTGYLLERIPLSPFQTEAEVLHTNALNVRDLDIIDINRLYLNVKRGLNILDMDNRTVISNLRLGIDPDLKEVSKNVSVSVKRKEIEKKATLTDPNPLQFGEYELPENILKYTGYHLWDTVRLGIRYKIKGANWTKVYHIKDQNIYQGLIDSSLDFSLTDTSDSFSYFLECTNLDWDFLINGEKLRNLIDDFQFVRVDINSEVLASGIMVISDDPNASTYDAYPNFDGLAPPITANRRVCYFYSPDTNITNGKQISWELGDRIINLGNANIESTYTPSVSPNGDVYEFDGQLSNGIQNIEVLDVIDFFKETLPVAAFPQYPAITVTLEDAQTANSFWYQCLALYLASGAGNVTSNFDVGVYNCIYIRPKSQLYPLDTTQSTYQPIWGVASNVLTDTSSTVYNVFGGDTFTMKRYLKTRDKETSVPNALAFGFYSQSVQNTQIAKYVFPGLNFPIPSSSLTGGLINAYLFGSAYLERDLVEYDNSFDILNLLNSYAPYSRFTTEQEESIATIYWSLQSLEDSEQNNDRYFLPLNQRALDATAGAIMHMIKCNDILYTLQPLRTERQYFDTTQMLRSVTSTEILLGTGQVMALKGEFKSNYGCLNKWSVHYGSTDGGRSYFFYVDAINRKIVRVGDDGTKVISDRENISTWAMKGLLFAKNQLTPFDNYGLHTGWDEKSGQLYITSRTFLKIKGDWDIYGEYEVGELVTNGYFYGLNDMPVIYRCIQDNEASVETEPQTGEDWELYWEIIENTIDNYNFWTLVWSEKENKFKWFVSPRPKVWICYKETMLSPSPVDENLVFEHTELGQEAHWYCRDMDITIIGVVSGNTIDTNDMSFRILENGFYRILEDGISRRLLSSSQGNIPTQTTWGETIWYIVDSNGVQYQIVSVIDGIITVVGDLPPNETEFSVVTCVFEEPYITNVINENKGKKFKFVFTKYNSLKAPLLVEYRTNQHKSYLTQSELTDVDQYYQSPIKVDTTNNPTDNETDASQLFGKYLVVKTFLGANIGQKINNFVVKIREMNPFINK